MLLTVLMGCELFEHRHYHDPHLKLKTADYDEIMRAPDYALLPPPALAQIEREVAPPLTASMKKTVSLTLNPGTPLYDVFRELSQQTGVGLALTPDTSPREETLSYSTRNQPLIQVVEDICRMTHHRFQIRGDMILIEPDIPYLQTYKVASLSQTRSSENRMSMTTDVFTVMENTKSRADNGSDSLLTSNSTSDFWEELDQNMAMIFHDPEVAKGAPSPHYTFHKQAGLLTIKASAQDHERVRDYLHQLRESTGTQVLIEAKIVEVNLDDQFQSGINWGYLGNALQLSSAMGALSTPGALAVASGLKRDVFTFAVDHKDFSSVLNLVKRFGTVRTLSNPRLTVMNNQPAMFKVATNEVFFQLEFDRYFQADGKPDVESFSSNVMTVPIGLVLVVQPAVDAHSNDVTLTLRPTVSRIERFVEDPAVAIKSAQKVTSKIPVIQVREIDSVLKMKSGQVLILGGLMEDRSRHQAAGNSLLDEIPILGDLTRGKDDARKVTELVIFLTAHIVRHSLITPADARIYNTYTQDPRPLELGERCEDG